jgi:hypothetical protein
MKAGVLERMYSARRAAVNVFAGLMAGLFASGQPTAAASARAQADPSAVSCDPAFARLFTPPHPRAGRYEVCVSARPIDAAADAGWRIEAASPPDAFGSAGTYNRAALARLYGGRQVQVARGWRESDQGFESLTLISPYPDPTLTRLEPGTLIIRLILCCR